jgi:hypothetical protein
MYDMLLKMLLDKQNLKKFLFILKKKFSHEIEPFLSGDVARIINASIEPPRNEGSSF